MGGGVKGEWGGLPSGGHPGLGGAAPLGQTEALCMRIPVILASSLPRRYLSHTAREGAEDRKVTPPGRCCLHTAVTELDTVLSASKTHSVCTAT